MIKQLRMKTMLLLCALIIGSVSSAWGETVTLDFTQVATLTVSKSGTSGTGGDVEISKDGMTITSNKGYYDSGNHLRVYSGGSFVVSSTVGEISKIEVTYTGSDRAKLNSYTNSGTTGTLNVSPSSASSAVTASAQSRISQVVITYTNAPKYTLLSIVAPASAGSVELGSTSIISGGMTTITATPNSGYRFVNWEVTGTGASVSDDTSASTTFTMGSENATVTANFELIPTYTVTFSVNGIESSNQYEENDAIVFPSDPSDIAGKVFVGWSESSIVGTTDTKPSFVSSATATSNFTYYAVFAKEEIGEGNITKTITATSKGVPSAYGSANTFNDCTIESIAFKVQQMYKNGEKLQWRASGNSNGTGTMYNIDALNKIQTIVLTYHEDDLNKNFIVNIGDSENPTSGTEITPSVSGNVYTFDCSDQNKNYFVLSNGTGAGYLESVAITYIGETTILSEYCTSLTASLSLASACTDGEDMYYATYSNDHAFVVPADLIVSEIKLDAQNKLVISNYATGAVVPANTGVMVSSDVAGAHTVNLSAEAGTSVLGAENLLKASSVAMTGDDFKFYRLTMHNGTDLGFYWGADGGAAFSIAANKAYLAVSTATAARIAGFNLFENEGEATAIEGVKTIGMDAPVFNLNGQRVNGNAKGLLIKNGKKYMNR